MNKLQQDLLNKADYVLRESSSLLGRDTHPELRNLLGNSIFVAEAFVALMDECGMKQLKRTQEWLDKFQGAVGDLTLKLLQSQEERDSLRAEIAELNALFALQHARTVEADALYVATHPRPEYPHGYRPDLGELIRWLLERRGCANERQGSCRGFKSPAEEVYSVECPRCHQIHAAGECRFTTEAKP